MNWINELLKNQFLITPILSWLISQVVKFIINAGMNRKLDFDRLLGDGGMPSSHSATVSALATITALNAGVGSFEFAMSAVFAVIVCHDACGVRLETGRQAKVINEILATYKILLKKDPPYAKLEEFVGHTPIQVAAGIVLGIINAFIMHNVIW